MDKIEKRFWSRVKKTNSCWLWTGLKNDGGYGRFYIGRKRIPAHRFAFGKPVPDGMDLAHLCENPACVNPSHLQIQTRSQNMRTAVKSGRAGRNITADKASQIKQMTRHEKKNGVIAERLGVSSTTVHRIRSGQSWAHL